MHYQAVLEIKGSNHMCNIFGMVSGTWNPLVKQLLLLVVLVFVFGKCVVQVALKFGSV